MVKNSSWGSGRERGKRRRHGSIRGGAFRVPVPDDAPPPSQNYPQPAPVATKPAPQKPPGQSGNYPAPQPLRDGTPPPDSDGEEEEDDFTDEDGDGKDDNDGLENLPANEEARKIVMTHGPADPNVRKWLQEYYPGGPNAFIREKSSAVKDAKVGYILHTSDTNWERPNGDIGPYAITHARIGPNPWAQDIAGWWDQHTPGGWGGWQRAQREAKGGGFELAKLAQVLKDQNIEPGIQDQRNVWDQVFTGIGNVVQGQTGVPAVDALIHTGKQALVNKYAGPAGGLEEGGAEDLGTGSLFGSGVWRSVRRRRR